MDTGPREEEVRAANEIFTLLTEGHGLAVIIDALAGRNDVSDEARSELSAPHPQAAHQGVPRRQPRAARPDWSRRSSRRSPKATTGLPRPFSSPGCRPVRRCGRGPPRTCGNEASTSSTRRRCGSPVAGTPTSGCSNATGCCGTATPCMRTATMPRWLSLVSGRFPGPPPVESELFRTWIDTLWDLPASAPEWPADAANLGKWIRFILREKERELIEGVVHAVAGQWNGIENEFNDDLRYLGIGPLTLQVPPGGPELLIGTLEFLTALRVQLEAYRPLRPQAASRQEEIERSEARRAAEDGILKLTAEWQERLAHARQAQDAATAAHGAESAVEEEEPPARKQADADPVAIEALTAERDRLQAELSTLREENGRLCSSNEQLRAESGRRDDETRKLNDLIVRSRRTEEQWRQAYVESRKGRRPDDTPVSIDSEAQLALEREHAVREPCGGVRRAGLARHRALRRKRQPHRRSLLRVDVQDEPARGIDREVPRVVRDAGRRKDLVSGRPHREGNQSRPAAHDPDRIRRDEEGNRVIVGFIGLHQRNRQS